MCTCGFHRLPQQPLVKEHRAVPLVVLQQNLASGEGPLNALGDSRNDKCIVIALLQDMGREDGSIFAAIQWLQCPIGV